MIKGLNINFPIEDDPVNNFFLERTLITKDAIKANLLLLFFTNIGERYYMPDYGLNLYKYLFDQRDEKLENEVIEEIKKRTSIYIPEVNINDLIINRDVDEKVLSLTINFTYNQNTFTETDTININIGI